MKKKKKKSHYFTNTEAKQPTNSRVLLTTYMHSSRNPRIESLHYKLNVKLEINDSDFL